MKVSKQVKWAIFTILLAFAAGTFVFQADAQTRRKKTVKKTAAAKPTPKPLATPMTLSDAEIISPASDLQEAQPAVVTPVKTGTDPVPTDNPAARIRDLSTRVKNLETPKKDPDEKQKRLLLNLDILTRSEQRADSLRKNLFEMIDKENTVKTRLDQIENDIRPEMIERTMQLSGSMHPEEIRDIRKKSLAAETANLQSLLTDIQSTRANMAASVQKADELVEKLRSKLEKEIDDSLKDVPEN